MYNQKKLEKKLVTHKKVNRVHINVVQDTECGAGMQSRTKAFILGSETKKHLSVSSVKVLKGLNWRYAKALPMNVKNTITTLFAFLATGNMTPMKLGIKEELQSSQDYVNYAVNLIHQNAKNAASAPIVVRQNGNQIEELQNLHNFALNQKQV